MIICNHCGKTVETRVLNVLDEEAIKLIGTKTLTIIQLSKIMGVSYKNTFFRVNKLIKLNRVKKTKMYKIQGSPCFLDLIHNLERG